MRTLRLAPGLSPPPRQAPGTLPPRPEAPAVQTPLVAVASVPQWPRPLLAGSAPRKDRLRQGLWLTWTAPFHSGSQGERNPSPHLAAAAPTGPRMQPRSSPPAGRTRLQRLGVAEASGGRRRRLGAPPWSSEATARGWLHRPLGAVVRSSAPYTRRCATRTTSPTRLCGRVCRDSESAAPPRAGVNLTVRDPQLVCCYKLRRTQPLEKIQ